MYREFFLLIFAYFQTLTSKETIYEICIPAGLAALLAWNFTLNDDIISTIMTTMSIVLGFVIATITILLTSEHKNIKDAKEFLLNKTIFGKNLNLFRKILILFFYIAFVALIELIIGVFTQIFNKYNFVTSFINIFLTLHIIFVTIRNLTNLFFIEFK